MEPHIIIPSRLAQAIVDYLKRRPFEEVAPLIEGLVKAPQAQIQEPAPAPTPEQEKKS